MANGCISTRAVQWATALYNEFRKPYIYIILLCICISFLIGSEVGRYSQTKINKQENVTVGSSKENEVNHQHESFATTITLSSSKEIEVNQHENVTTTTVGSSKKIEVNQQENATTAMLESTNDVEDNIVTISEYGNYLVMASKDARLISIQKDCTNCTKFYFNETQLKEIRSFLETCYKEHSCNFTNWPAYKGLCRVCDPVISMRTSNLYFCIDTDSEINSAFIDGYIIYHGTLDLLYVAHHYFKSDI